MPINSTGYLWLVTLNRRTVRKFIAFLSCRKKERRYFLSWSWDADLLLSLSAAAVKGKQILTCILWKHGDGCAVKEGIVIYCGIRANNQISPAPVFCNFEVPPHEWNVVYHCSLAKVRVEQRLLAGGSAESRVRCMHQALTHSLACIHNTHVLAAGCIIEAAPVIAPRQSREQAAVRVVR